MEKKPQFTGPKRPTTPNSRPGNAPEQADRQKRGADRNSKDPYRVNDAITAREVRLVGDLSGQWAVPDDYLLVLTVFLALRIVVFFPLSPFMRKSIFKFNQSYFEFLHSNVRQS